MEKHEIVDPALQFMEGPNRGTYDKFRSFLQTNRDNFSALGLEEELAKLESYLSSDKPWAGNATKQALDTFTSVSAQISKRLEEERENARSAIGAAVSDIQEQKEYTNLEESDQEQLLRPLKKDLSDRAGNTTSIATLQNIAEIRVPETLEKCRRSCTARPIRKRRSGTPPPGRSG